MAEPVDGFLYNLNYRKLCGWYLPAVLAQLDELRRTNNYRPVLYTVPGGSVVVPAYGSYEYQLAVPDGTILWAYSFSNPNGLYGFNLFDPCRGRIASDDIRGSGTSPTLWQGVCILPTPYYAVGNGTLSIEIGSLSTTASVFSDFQLLLIGLAPVETDCKKL